MRSSYGIFVCICASLRRSGPLKWEKMAKDSKKIAKTIKNNYFELIKHLFLFSFFIGGATAPLFPLTQSPGHPVTCIKAVMVQFSQIFVLKYTGASQVYNYFRY